MLELRWVTRRIPCQIEGSIPESNIINGFRYERVLQYRTKVVGDGGVFVWSDWQDAPDAGNEEEL